MEAGHGNADDLAALAKLSEQTLLSELEIRYGNSQIYTYIGDILIALNPFEQLPIYGSQHSRQYRNIKIQSKLKPHVFAIADRMYHNLLNNSNPQCCIVSGESGSGKTETTKLLIRQLVQQCSQASEALSLHDALIEINPLMEAFGNANTTMNENSSRFGKYIEIFFTDDGRISGGRVSIFLLEKTRVTSYGKDERNFHIFYHMFAGLTDKQKNQILLGRPDEYRVLRSHEGASILESKADHLHHKASFIQLQKIFTDIGFTQEESDTILAYLSAILSLTNIQFELDQETDGVFIADEYPLLVATELLGIGAEELATSLISNINSIRGEEIVSLKNMAQADDGRDALARSLYSRLFSWIINKINTRLKPSPGFAPRSPSAPIIGLLDIAGFENFASNSLEQLCINVSNEQLQHFFNQHVFAWEKRDLEMEGVKTSHISFTNNSGILSMFIEKPIGLFALVDEESKFPRATAQSLLEKIKKHLGKHPHIKKEKGKEPMFSIQHYAGWVKYSVVGMLEKNRDTLSQNIIDCLQKSESGMIYELFSSQLSGNSDLAVPTVHRTKRSILMCKQSLSMEKGKSLSKSAGRKLKQHIKGAFREVQDDLVFKHRTAGSQFQDSLAALTKKLMACQPHFIRCIKPNSLQARKRFDQKLVAQQLKYTGILETVRIRHEGFPVRLPFHVFLERYRFISFPLTSALPADSTHCYTILRQAGLLQWEIGTKKVFLKYWHPEQLDLALGDKVKQVLLVQKVVRGFIGRRRAAKLREILLVRKQAQAKSFLMSISEKGQLMFNSLRDLNNSDLRQFKLRLEEEARTAHEQQLRAQMVEEKKRKLRLLEAEKERKAAELRLYEAAQKVEELTKAKPLTAAPTTDTPTSVFHQKHEVSSADDNKNTWRKAHVNHKEHVRGLLQRLEGKAVEQKSPMVRRRTRGVNGKATSSQNNQSTPVTPVSPSPLSPSGVGRRLFPKSVPQDISIPNGHSHHAYEKGNSSHYARQSSSGNLRISKADHYDGLIQEALLNGMAGLDKHWAKIVYMEKRQRCATFLLSETSVKIDGAALTQNPQSHVALNSVENPLRDERVARMREHIGKGVALEVDSEGNVYVTRCGVNDVIVHDHRNPSLSCISADIIKQKGVLQRDHRVKLFDMKEFRSHIILELHRQGSSKLDLKALYPRCCIVSLTFVKCAAEEMQDPCWINIIHLDALRMIQDRAVHERLEKELRKIMSSNIDLEQISQLPSFLKVQPKVAVKSSKEKESSYTGVEKIYATPEPVLDRGAKPANDITFQKHTPRGWVKQKYMYSRPG